MSSLLGLLSESEFRIGLVVGLAGLVVTALLRRHRLDWAIVWSAAALVGLGRAGLFDEARPIRRLDLQPWLVAIAVVVCLLAAFGLRRGRAHSNLAAGFVASMLGMWATVPDTEAISVLVGVTAAMVWSWWPLRLAWPRPLGSGAATAIAALATIVGGSRREAAVIGGLGILAAVGSLGLVQRWFGRRFAPLDIGLHFALVAIWFAAPRFQPGPVQVLLSGTIASGLVLAVAWIVAATKSSNWARESGETTSIVIRS